MFLLTKSEDDILSRSTVSLSLSSKILTTMYVNHHWQQEIKM
jgi:hypothetical protein